MPTSQRPNGFIPLRLVDKPSTVDGPATLPSDIARNSGIVHCSIKETETAADTYEDERPNPISPMRLVSEDGVPYELSLAQDPTQGLGLPPVTPASSEIMEEGPSDSSHNARSSRQMNTISPTSLIDKGVNEPQSRIEKGTIPQDGKEGTSRSQTLESIWPTIQPNRKDKHPDKTPSRERITSQSIHEDLQLLSQFDPLMDEQGDSDTHVTQHDLAVKATPPPPDAKDQTSLVSSSTFCPGFGISNYNPNSSSPTLLTRQNMSLIQYAGPSSSTGNDEESTLSSLSEMSNHADDHLHLGSRHEPDQESQLADEQSRRSKRKRGSISSSSDQEDEQTTTHPTWTVSSRRNYGKRKYNVKLLKMSKGAIDGSVVRWPKRGQDTIIGRMQEIACGKGSSEIKNQRFCPSCLGKKNNPKFRPSNPPSDRCIRPDCIMRGKKVPWVKEGDDAMFLVERIVGQNSQKTSTGIVNEYLIFWEDWPISDCTWEPEANIPNLATHYLPFNARAEDEGKNTRESGVILLREAEGVWSEDGRLIGSRSQRWKMMGWPEDVGAVTSASDGL